MILVLAVALLAQATQAEDRKSAAAALGLPPVALQPPGQVELGRLLFNDVRLSANGKMSCATCHDPAQAFTQTDRRTPTAKQGAPLRRNAPTLLNVAFAKPLMHDGAAPSLEAQVLTPLFDPKEMANPDFAALEARLSNSPQYVARFRDVFAAAPTVANIGQALASFERTLIAGNAPFDRWKYAGDATALSPLAREGFALFTGKARCATCHTIDAAQALFTDNAMHNTGIGAKTGKATKTAHPQNQETVDFSAAGDRGRHEITGRPEDLFSYRTPTLRNVAATAPYMHDGSLATLEEVVRFYDRGGHPNPQLAPLIAPLDLRDHDIAALVAFLQSLTSDDLADVAKRASISP